MSTLNIVLTVASLGRKGKSVMPKAKLPYRSFRSLPHLQCSVILRRPNEIDQVLPKASISAPSVSRSYFGTYRDTNVNIRECRIVPDKCTKRHRASLHFRLAKLPTLSQYEDRNVEIDNHANRPRFHTMRLGSHQTRSRRS